VHLPPAACPHPSLLPLLMLPLLMSWLLLLPLLLCLLLLLPLPLLLPGGRACLLRGPLRGSGGC